MKKAFLLILALMAWFVLFGFSGTGTELDPYLISSVSDLAQLATDVIGGEAYSGKYFEQTVNLDLNVAPYNSGTGWISIGWYDDSSSTAWPFSGIFNGNNNTISNLYINKPASSYVGLFGFIQNATIKNVGILNINSTSFIGAGGLAGGGISSNFSNCYSTGTISANGYLGGLLGASMSSVVTNCYSTCTVVGIDTGTFVGGLIGYNTSSSISNCYSTGNVTAGSYGGGFIGLNTSSSTIEYCYSKGNVSSIGASATSLGGFVGISDANIYKCYSTGWVKIDGIIQTTCGFCGTVEAPSDMSDNYWDITTSGATSSGGIAIGKTTTEMMTENLAGWDFVNIWERVGGYPRLRTNQEEATLPVELSSFTAVNTSENGVNLSWTTQSESNVLGYSILRNTELDPGNASRVNFSLISGTNTSTECIYNFSDNDVMENTYYYWLESVEYDGTSQMHGPVKVVINSSTPSGPTIDLKTTLKGAYPNPFNPSTTISYELSKASKVSISVYNAKGQIVTNLFNGNKNPGHFNIVWNGMDKNNNNCTSGVYFIKMDTDGFTSIKKVMMVK